MTDPRAYISSSWCVVHGVPEEIARPTYIDLDERVVLRAVWIPGAPDPWPDRETSAHPAVNDRSRSGSGAA